MGNVLRWSALGVGICAALVLVSGCKNDGGGIGGLGGAPANTAAGGASQGGSGGSGGGSGGGSASGGVNCQVSKVSTCLMPKPDNATSPQGKWAKDGAMTKADYVDWFASDQDEKDRENSKLASANFVSAGYSHWQNSHGTQAELALTSFGSAAGATQWIDYDNEAFGDSDEYQKLDSSIQGADIFTVKKPNDDGTYTTFAIGRFGQTVMEFYSYASKQNDPVAQNNLASWAATQIGILKRATSTS